METQNTIEVVVDLPVDHTFTYRVPEHLSERVSPGKRVLVPFGKRRKVTGYILGWQDRKTDFKLKDLIDVLDEYPLFPESMMSFFKWISEYYMHPLGDVLRCALPVGLNISDRNMVSITEAGREALRLDAEGMHADVKEVLSLIAVRSMPEKTVLTKTAGRTSNAILQELTEKGWINRFRQLNRPSAKVKTERYVRLCPHQNLPSKLSAARKTLIAMLEAQEDVALKELRKVAPSAAAVIRSMEAKGIVETLEKRVFRDPFGQEIEPDTPPVLTPEQEDVVNIVSESMGIGYRAFLLEGVTGSGKTEVYMRLANDVVRSGKTVLVLVPEIALISQMERRFRARFGSKIAVLHSGLSMGERYDQWDRILGKKTPIAIGTRSAIFAPFSDIGLIIVDEEHDASYKQESELMYNARDLALVRAMLHRCTAILGSATPSVQSYYNTGIGKLTPIVLPKRVADRPLPDIEIVDLRKYGNAKGIDKFITPLLKNEMEAALNRKEQILLFLNRRGFATFPVCAKCGEAMLCHQCDISMTYHRREDSYQCHYCENSIPASSPCPTCGSSGIKRLGVGTEKIESAVRKMFPDARIERMDHDTTKGKNATVDILKKMHRNEIDILVGTQMITKGHDFPNITLVGIILADASLNFPDFRAGERTFQILAQVAGRAGRGDSAGKVILQTFNPDHFCIKAAKAQDFETFYQTEIVFRKTLKYPPFSRIVQLRISGKSNEKTKETAQSLGDACRRIQKKTAEFHRTIDILGPVESPLSRIAGKYRRQILIKAMNTTIVHGFMRELKRQYHKLFENRSVHIAVDIDPMSLM